MADYKVDLPLYSDPFYSYTISLEDNTYSMEFVLNERAGMWYMSMFTEDGEPIVRGIALVPNYPLLADYVIPELTGFFLLLPIPSITTEKYKEEPEYLSQYYTLRYLYTVEE